MTGSFQTSCTWKDNQPVLVSPSEVSENVNDDPLMHVVFPQVSGIEDLYVYKGGNVRLGKEARLGEVSQVREVALQSLHVQDGGTFEVDSGHHTNDVTIIADTVKVRISSRYVTDSLT